MSVYGIQSPPRFMTFPVLLKNVGDLKESQTKKEGHGRHVGRTRTILTGFADGTVKRHIIQEYPRHNETLTFRSKMSKSPQ